MPLRGGGEAFVQSRNELAVFGGDFSADVVSFNGVEELVPVLLLRGHGFPAFKAGGLLFPFQIPANEAAVNF